VDENDEIDEEVDEDMEQDMDGAYATNMSGYATTGDLDAVINQFTGELLLPPPAAIKSSPITV